MCTHWNIGWILTLKYWLLRTGSPVLLSGVCEVFGTTCHPSSFPAHRHSPGSASQGTPFSYHSNPNVSRETSRIQFWPCQVQLFKINVAKAWEKMNVGFCLKSGNFEGFHGGNRDGLQCGGCSHCLQKQGIYCFYGLWLLGSSILGQRVTGISGIIRLNFAVILSRVFLNDVGGSDHALLMGQICEFQQVMPANNRHHLISVLSARPLRGYFLKAIM